MKNRLLISGFMLSIILISAIGFYALHSNWQIIKTYETGETHFEEIATAATEVSSYVKRAEGHLFLYLTLHRIADKDKFPKRMGSVHEQILILDHKIENINARKILEEIKANTEGILSAGYELIESHDKSMAVSGRFDFDQHREAIINLHYKFSAVRKYGVELAALEIKLEHMLKLKASGDAARVQFYLLVMMTLTTIYAVFLGYTLIKILRALNQEVIHRRQSEQVIQLERNKLEDALDQVKALSGLLPICAECKKIRDDKGYWNQIESYIREHSEAEFSHGICPDCMHKLYPEFVQKNDDKY